MLVGAALTAIVAATLTTALAISLGCAEFRGAIAIDGGYFGWKIYDKLRLDDMLTYGRINYSAAAGGPRPPLLARKGQRRGEGLTRTQ